MIETWQEPFEFVVQDEALKVTGVPLATAKSTGWPDIPFPLESVTVAVAVDEEEPLATMLAGLRAARVTVVGGPGVSVTFADALIGLGNAELSVAVICIDPAAAEVWTVAV